MNGIASSFPNHIETQLFRKLYTFFVDSGHKEFTFLTNYLGAYVEDLEEFVVARNINK